MLISNFGGYVLMEPMLRLLVKIRESSLRTGIILRECGWTMVYGRSLQPDSILCKLGI